MREPLPTHYLHVQRPHEPTQRLPQPLADNAPFASDDNMSSAVPIHPILRLMRQGAASRTTATAACRLMSSTPAHSAKPLGKLSVKASQRGGRGNASSSSSAPERSTSSPASPTSSSRESPEQSAALNSAGRGKGATPTPSSVKLVDKRVTQSQIETEESSSQGKHKTRKDGLEEGPLAGSAGEEVDGSVQKMLKGASMHPAAVEQSRQAAAAAKPLSSASPSPLQENSVTIDEETATGEGEESRSQMAEGIVIPAGRASARSASSAPTSDQSSPPTSSSSPLSGGGGNNSGGGGGIVTPPSSDESADHHEGESGPPATTQPPELGHARVPNPQHPFDTHAFIKRLQNADFITRRVETSESGAEEPSAQTSLSSTKRHDPAEAIMEATRHLLVSRGERVLDHHISKTEVENQAYLFTAALSELRTELQVRARNDAAALRSMVTLLQREVDGLNQKMREDVGGMKHDIQVDMNNRKGESKEEQNTLEQEIQDLNNRFTISISDLKTEIEQNIKWDATRRALTVVFGCVVILIATLTAADYLTREEAEGAASNTRSSESSTKTANNAILPPTKSAEELGLVANYDDGDGSRYV